MLRKQRLLELLLLIPLKNMFVSSCEKPNNPSRVLGGFSLGVFLVGLGETTLLSKSITYIVST